MLLSSKISVSMLVIVLCVIIFSVGCKNATRTRRTAFEYMDVAREAGPPSSKFGVTPPANRVAGVGPTSHPFYEHGREGWELIAVSGPYEMSSPSDDTSGRYFLFHFKRVVFIE
jgi:hypothetical protein